VGVTHLHNGAAARFRGVVASRCDRQTSSKEAGKSRWDLQVEEVRQPLQGEFY